MNTLYNPFNVKDDELSPFEVEDVFNPGNTLKGLICRRADHRYGALYITHVNGKKSEQIIYGTPKMHYPFDKLGRWCWPKINKLNVYEKIDGTNVTSFSYKTYDGQKFVSYKTRLTPTVSSGRFGAFKEMWIELLEKYPDIPKYVLDHDVTLCMEMYGSRNIHLISYSVSLEAALLFGLDPLSASVIDPEDLPETASLRLPKVSAKQTLASGHDVNTFYKKLQAEREAMNVQTDFGIEGGEGYIFYAHDSSGRVTQLKCKPQTIQELHWANGGLRKEVIRLACFKAIESDSENISIDSVKKVLLEDYDNKQVEAYHYLIDTVLEDVQTELTLRGAIRKAYEQAKITTGETINSNKAVIMRWLSQHHFSRDQMGWVYHVITNLEES